MNTIELIDYLHDFKTFSGVFPRDMLNISLNRNSGIIINTDKAQDPGEHWVSIYLNNDGFAVYFDSFGLPPLHSEIVNFINNISPRGYYYNSITFQNIKENTCGLYCVYFLSNMLRGHSFECFVQIFSHVTEQNDLKAKFLYKLQ